MIKRIFDALPMDVIITKLLDAIPMTGYRTYITNGIVIVLFVVVGILTGQWEVAMGFIGAAVSSMFAKQGQDRIEVKAEAIEQALQIILTEKLIEERSRPEYVADTRGDDELPEVKL